MQSSKHLKLRRVIKERFSEILTKEGANIYGTTFVSVSEVELSPDLSHAFIYISVLEKDKLGKIVELVNDHHFHLKQQLYKQIRHKMRKMPKVHLLGDDSLHRGAAVNKLIDELTTSRQENENQNEEEE